MNDYIKIEKTLSGLSVKIGSAFTPLSNIPGHISQLRNLLETALENSIEVSIYTSDPAIIALLPLLRTSKIIFTPTSFRERLQLTKVSETLNLAGISTSINKKEEKEIAYSLEESLAA